MQFTRCCRESERRQNPRVEVAVIFPLHILYNGIDVVVADGLEQRLCLPAEPAALPADPDRVEILELGQGPTVLGAVSAEEVPTVSAVLRA